MKESEIRDQITNKDMPVAIRPMEAKDVVEASKIEAEVFSMPWKAENFLEMVEAPYAYYFVACANSKAPEMAVIATEMADETERIVGIIGLRDIAGEGEITNVAVKGEYRGLGVGRKLVKKALDQCSQLGISNVTLEVRASNQVAISLYESVGFKGEGYRPNFYEHPTEDALIMWKR